MSRAIIRAAFAWLLAIGIAFGADELGPEHRVTAVLLWCMAFTAFAGSFGFIFEAVES